MKTEWNAYAARFWITTARRANMEGQRVSRTHGYVIRCDPPAPAHTNQVYAWCKTLGIALKTLEGYEDSKRKGYWGCPCGSGKQAVRCCGIPKEAEQNAPDLDPIDCGSD